MEDLIELKEWLRIDYPDDDLVLSSLLTASKFIIKQSTGIALEDVQTDSEALELYKTVQKIIITNLYENRDGSSKISPVLTGLYTQLEVYKLSLA